MCLCILPLGSLIRTGSIFHCNYGNAPKGFLNRQPHLALAPPCGRRGTEGQAKGDVLSECWTWAGGASDRHNTYNQHQGTSVGMLVGELRKEAEQLRYWWAARCSGLRRLEESLEQDFQVDPAHRSFFVVGGRGPFYKELPSYGPSLVMTQS